METLAHLHQAVQPVALEDDDSRIRRIRMDRWISYARADAALQACEELLTFPKRTRMPNLLIVGPTNNGKTMIVEKFRRSHLPTAASASAGGIARVPVLKIQMPPGPDEARFFGAILEALNLPYLDSDRVTKRQSRAVSLMRETQVQILIIDEVHNLLSGSRLQQRRILNLLRWLGNELQIPLVAVGTAEALHAIQSDEQLVNRFDPVRLPHWQSGKEYRQLLNTLESVLPLRKPSNLRSDALAEQILSAAEGILGEVISLVARAAILAINSGNEAITSKSIERSGFVPPSKRRHGT